MCFAILRDRPLQIVAVRQPCRGNLGLPLDDFRIYAVDAYFYAMLVSSIFCRALPGLRGNSRGMASASALVFEQHGAPETVLALKEIPLPDDDDLADTEILVEMLAVRMGLHPLAEEDVDGCLALI